jgi:hypothetical protein
MFNYRILLLSLLAVMMFSPQLVGAVSFDAGTEFKGAVGQGPVIFVYQVNCSSMTSDGLNVMFTEFTMSGGSYSAIGFASSIGCTMTVSKTSAEEIRFTSQVTADLATATVYIPEKPAPVKVTGAQSWSLIGDAVTVILPKGTGEVSISYVADALPDTGDISDLLKQYTPDIPAFIRENLLLISAAIIIAYLAGASGAATRRKIKRKLKP